ncbi:MAG: bacteriohemerythrin [Spirochaetes bacterium]|nr:bacteriohemerythrin [Spirochaetota bacterium]
MEKRKITNGVFWVEEPKAGFYILCGCPADSIKHLIKRGMVVPKEKKGVQYETGPNAILLSDVPIQNGMFSNLAEFPVLQMLYRQGMIIPGHPNNTGARPMLIGLEDQVHAQSGYIYRGNYGLSTIEEIVDAGTPRDLAVQMMRMKKRFAFDNIRESEELIEFRVIDREVIELRDGMYVRRKGINVYEFMYEETSTTVDLNLPAHEMYTPPYTLDYHCINRELFSVIHTGEGDGWDESRPCMASIISYKGKLYLIDAGPNVIGSLTALGIGVNEIEGIFHTHAHDDHFAGLPTLIRSSHRINYYATPLVRRSVVRKIEALTGITEAQFKKYFLVHDLDFDRWNDIDGLEVMPVLSPHPVETSILYFRTAVDGEYRSYAHLADIASFKVLGGMVTEDRKKSGISAEYFEQVKESYTIPVDLKKIDIGGGYIHGMAEDFVRDRSKKLVLSHTALPLSDAQKEIGSSAGFGTEDVLFSSDRDFPLESARRYLKLFFEYADAIDLELFESCHLLLFPPGQILLRSGSRAAELYLLTSGLVEVINPAKGNTDTIGAGCLLGEWSILNKKPSEYTFRTKSYARALRIPGRVFRAFITKHSLFERSKERYEKRRFLGTTRVFGDTVSCEIQNRIAGEMQSFSFGRGERPESGGKPLLYILESGSIELYSKDRLVETLEGGDFFGEERILKTPATMFEARVTKRAKVFGIPGELLINIPIVQLKLFERLKRRVKRLKTRFGIEWSDEYGVRIRQIDLQHKELFTRAGEILIATEKKAPVSSIQKLLIALLKTANSHFKYEETLLKNNGYPGAEDHSEIHSGIIRELENFSSRLRTEKRTVFPELLDFLREWLVRHTLTVDRKYIRFLREKGVT